MKKKNIKRRKRTKTTGAFIVYRAAKEKTKREKDNKKYEKKEKKREAKQFVRGLSRPSRCPDKAPRPKNKLERIKVK